MATRGGKGRGPTAPSSSVPTRAGVEGGTAEQVEQQEDLHRSGSPVPPVAESVVHSGYTEDAVPAAISESPTPLVTRMSSLYSGLHRAHGIYQLMPRKVGGKKVQGRAVTVRGAVDEALWTKHLAGTQGLGIVPICDDNTCVFGAIDIDRYDLRLDEVEAQCAKLNLPLLPTRTKSGGVHLYCFTREPVPAALMKQRLEEWSVALGYGGAEVFPKQNALASAQDVGNWINMPYFGALSSEPTERYAVFKGVQLTLPQFLDRAETLRLTEDQLEQLVIAEGDEFAEGPPCLQSLARSGFGEGMRNNGLFAVGVYLKKRYPDDWGSHLLAYNVRFMKPPLTDAEVRALQKTLGRKDYNYTCNKAPLKQFCNRNLCHTREFGVGKGIDDWGLVIDSDVQMVKTNPPYWMVTINSERVMLTSQHIISQRDFIRLCVERLRVHPPMLPSDKWRAEVNKILQNATEVEAPEDASAGGELAFHLKQFCTVFPQAEVREEMLTGKPWSDAGLTHFRAADFKKYLEAQHFRALSGPKLYAELRAMGLEHRQLWAGDQNLLVWSVKQFEKPRTEVPDRHIDDESGM